MEIATDPYSGEEFFKTRINQRFAKPENRIKYYNDKSNLLRWKLSFVEKPLRKNYTIINSLMKNAKEKDFHKEYLRGTGFNFSVFSHFSKHGEKKYPTIYEYLIIADENERIKILRDDRLY